LLVAKAGLALTSDPAHTIGREPVKPEAALDGLLAERNYRVARVTIDNNDFALLTSMRVRKPTAITT